MSLLSSATFSASPTHGFDSRQPFMSSQASERGQMKYSVRGAALPRANTWCCVKGWLERTEQCVQAQKESGQRAGRFTLHASVLSSHSKEGARGINLQHHQLVQTLKLHTTTIPTPLLSFP